MRGPLVGLRAMTDNNAGTVEVVETDDGLPILVVGGTGFVGASLCQFLFDSGHPVTAASRSQRLIFCDSEIAHLKMDVLAPIEVDQLSTFPIAIVCPWVDQSYDQLTGQWIDRLVRLLVERGTRSLIYISSMWVYGTDPEDLLTESTLVAPNNAYGSAHAVNEAAVAASASELGVDVAILRMANLVGPDPFFRFRTKISFAHEIMEMALFERTIMLRSPPSTARNFLPASLFHHYIAKLLDRPLVEGRVDFFNFGSGSTSTILGLAEDIALIAERWHGGLVTIEHPEELEVQPQFRLDTTKIRQIAGSHADDLSGELSKILRQVVSVRDPAAVIGKPV